MESLNSAEAVTRYLRLKTISAEDAQSAAHMLWRGELPVYLPNTAHFLFELLCDRMGDFGHGSFSRWKKNPALWRLWRLVYACLSETDMDARSAIFARVKLLQIMTSVLDECVEQPEHICGGSKCHCQSRDRGSQPSDPSTTTTTTTTTTTAPTTNKKRRIGPHKLQLHAVNTSQCQSLQHDLVQEMFLCVQDIVAHGYIDVDEFVAVGLLASYCRYMKRFGVAESQWTDTVRTLYQLPQQYILYKPGKSTWARYFLQVVPVQLSLFVDTEFAGNAVWDESVLVMHLIFCTFLFKYTSSAGLVQPVTQLVEDQKAGQPRMSDSCVLRLFHEIISNLAVSEIHTCEAVYKALVLPPYAHLAEKLVSILAKVNRTLSPDFYASAYADAMACVPVNWNLVSHIMKLHPPLHTGWRPVVDGCQHFQADALAPIANNLVSSFAGARELSLFMLDLYPHAAQYAGWSHPKILDGMAAQLTDLSAKVLLSLASQYLQALAVKPMSLLVRVLARASALKQKQCQPFFSQVSKMPTDGWAEVIYQVTCLYPNVEGLAELAVISPKPSDYERFLVFRLSELQKLQVTISLPSLLKQYVLQLDQDSLPFFFQRWLVLCEQQCPEVYPELFRQMFRIWDKSQIMAFLDSQKMLICEMTNFLSALSVYIQENYQHLEDVGLEITPVWHEILRFFPEVVIRRFFSPFLEILIQQALDKNPISERAFLARSTLNHLLSKPNLLSSIEKTFEALYDYVVSSDDRACEVTLETAQNIWNSHLRSIKTQKSAEFVESAMKEMKRTIKAARKDSKRGTKEAKKTSRSTLVVAEPSAPKPFASILMLLTHRILSVKTDKVDLNDIKHRFVALICSSVDSHNFEENIALLDTLPGMSEVESDISAVLHNYGAFPMKAQTKTKMFSLMTKIAGEAKASYVLALFLVLRTQLAECRCVLQEALSEYLRRISEHAYAQCFEAALASLHSWHEFGAANLDVLAALAPLIRRDQALHHRLVTGAMLRFLQHCDRLEQDTSLTFLRMLTDLVSGTGWVMQPYTVELMMLTAHKVVTAVALTEPVYVATTKLVMYVVNAHRSKLYGRYHILCRVVSGLMGALTAKTHRLTQKGSVETCAAALSRLLNMLCEPPVQTSGQSDSLTSKSAVYRAALRKHAHVMLVNYIHMQLEQKFSPETSDALKPGIYSLIGLLSLAELNLVSLCLDSLGRVYFQSLYGLYRDHGKWRE